METIDANRPALAAAPRWRGLHELVWGRPVVGVLLIALASRLFFVLIAMVSASQVDAWPAGAWQRGPAWVQPFARWDSGYYLDIAQEGYGSKPELWAFHPGYPLLIRLFGALLPGVSPVVVGFVISNAAFLASVPLFFEFTKRLAGSDHAIRATVLLSWFPAAFFFTAVYPESLFLLFLVPALKSFGEEKWLSAGLWAAAANAVRPQGLFLAPAFVAILSWRWIQGRRPALRSLAAPLGCLLFVAIFSIYAWDLTGDPFVWLHAREAVWNDVGLHDPFTTIGRAFTQVNNYGLSVLGLALLLVAAGYGIVELRRGRRTAALAAHAFTIILLLVHAVYAATPSVLRYCLAALPLFWFLADVTARPWRLYLALGLSAAIGGLVAHLFATWGDAF